MSRPLASRIITALLLLSSIGACDKGNQQQRQPLNNQAPTTPAPDPSAAPNMEVIQDPAQNPYLHNPVSWRYLSTRYLDGVCIFDVLLSLTSTWQHEFIDEVGVVMRMVLEIQGGGPVSHEYEIDVPPQYQSRLAIMSPAGLLMSEANPPAVELEAAAEHLNETSMTWPLEGTQGCNSEERPFELPIGRIRGVFTHCPDIQSDYGRATVSTIWVDRVGFVFREINPLEDSEDPLVYRDFLLEGDLVELAPTADGTPDLIIP